ncbi:MAG: hypothetical protein IT385_20220 [Deltaproteobacteria bacterium]|nr:hypothetical protein [Deltaproteobacteria bacterium]
MVALALARRRVAALALLVVATALAAAAPHVGLKLPRPPELAMFAAGALLAIVLGLRLHRAARRADDAGRRAHARAEAGRALSAELAWVDTTSEAETPEVEALRRALARRHEEVSAASGEVAERPIALQREALVEAVRRGWLAPERLIVLEARLVALAATEPPPAPDVARPIVHAATALWAALLPLTAAQRITYALIAGAVGLLFVLIDALGD